MSVSVTFVVSKTLEVGEEAVKYEQEIVDKVRELLQGIEGVQTAQAIGGNVGTIDLTPQAPTEQPAGQPTEQPAPPAPAPGAEQPQPGPAAAEEVQQPQPPDGTDGGDTGEAQPQP